MVKYLVETEGVKVKKEDLQAAIEDGKQYAKIMSFIYCVFERLYSQNVPL